MHHLSFVEGIRYLDVHPVLPDDTPEEIKSGSAELLSSLLLNSALAAHKLGGSVNAQSAVNWTTRAIERLTLSDAEKGKALYRRALSYATLHEEELAEEDLQKALEIVPGDAACTAELGRLQAARKAKREKEKRAQKTTTRSGDQNALRGCVSPCLQTSLLLLFKFDSSTI